jgi:enoyl-CoA hydratase
LARPERRNAQDKAMLFELDEQLTRAMRDSTIQVVVVAADGPDFSSGHDLKDRSTLAGFPSITGTGGFDQPGPHGHMALEEEIYVGLCWRWRNLPKPTIAQVQGRVIAGGLMLVWPFDLIVASEDAWFSDPVVAFGVNGHEYFVHAYELGPRKAKEMLFTGAPLSARQCEQLGMVNQVVPRDELEATALDLADRIAKRPAFGLRLAKLAVNNSMDIQGQWSAIQSAFALHHVGHAHDRIIHDGLPIDPNGLDVIRTEAKHYGRST